MLCMNRPIIPIKPTQDSYISRNLDTMNICFYIYIFLTRVASGEAVFFLRKHSSAQINFFFEHYLCQYQLCFIYVTLLIALPFLFMRTQILLYQDLGVDQVPLVPDPRSARHSSYWGEDYSCSKAPQRYGSYPEVGIPL